MLGCYPAFQRLSLVDRRHQGVLDMDYPLRWIAVCGSRRECVQAPYVRLIDEVSFH